MSRFPALLLLAAALAPPARASDDLARFGRVEIAPASASFYIASVSMSYQPFQRRGAAFASSYVARVFPYFFLGEKGRIWINVPDDALRRVLRGEAVSFSGRAVNDSGDERKVEGTATPTGPWGGKIRVRVSVTRRIVLSYNTTYVLKGPRDAPAKATPTPAR